MSHTNRFVGNRVIVSGARSGQGRAWCARRSEPLTARTPERASGYQRNGEISVAYGSFNRVSHFHVGLVVSQDVLGTAHLLSVPGIEPEHLMQHARLKRLATSLVKQPLLQIGHDPARSTGASTNSKMSSILSPFFSSTVFNGPQLLSERRRTPDNATDQSPIVWPSPRFQSASFGRLRRRIVACTIG